MSLWVDKYRPHSLSKLDYHLDQAAMLKKLIQSGDFPHLLIFGPDGVGKRTRIMAILKELYGSGVEKLRHEHQSFVTPSNKKIEISTIASNYHIEVNPSDVGFYDRIVIQELIKTLAQTNQLDTTTQKEFKVVVITEANHLSKDAQHALRRTMEKYMSTCRLILCGSTTSKIIDAIKSRCLAIRVSSPTQEEIMKILVFVSKKEGLVLPLQLAKEIADHCEGNLRKSLLTLEACKVQQYPFTDNQLIARADWEDYLKDTALKVVEEQTPQRLMEIRERLNELIIHCIPAEFIMKKLLDELLINCDGTLKTRVINFAAKFEHRMQKGQKQIYHLEAFIASFMAMYKSFLDDGALLDW